MEQRRTHNQSKRFEKLDREIDFVEGILKRMPDDIVGLQVLGDLYSRRGRIYDSLNVDRKLSRLCPENSTVFYNLACSFSLLNQLDEALEALKRAIELGYQDLSAMMEDDDLHNLRSNPRFHEIKRILSPE